VLCLAKQVKITVCLLRFGVNGSFYLLYVKELYKFVCKFHAHLCKFRARATVLRCTFLCKGFTLYMPTEEFVNSYCVHPSCTKMCNAEPLHIFVQLGCTFVQVSLSETCTHLVQATYEAHDLGIDAGVHHTNQKKPQHTAITLPPDHGRCPPR